MLTHALFPTLIGEWYYERHYHFKDIFFRNVLNHIGPNGEWGENSGHIDVHHDPDFVNFFTMTSFFAKEYVSQLQVDIDLWDFNLVKSWLTISDKWSVPNHNHEDAHLSFVYYMNIPDKIPSAPIHFANMHKPNDLTGNMFHLQGDNSVMVKQWNAFNSLSWNWTPNEGQLFIFPANLRHHTQTGYPGANDPLVNTVEGLKNRRISLAGDFLLTFKENKAISYGLQPVSNWKVFA